MHGDRLNALASARQERSPFVIAVEMTRMPMIFTDASEVGKRVVFANDAFLKLMGYTWTTLIGQPLGLLFDHDAYKIDEIIAGVCKDEESDVRCRRHNGTVFWATVLIGPVVDVSGITTNFFASFIDQSRHLEEKRRILALNADVMRKSGEVRALQASIIQASRLSAMGMIGATMAHEINQPLTAITNYLRGARQRLEAANLPVSAVVLDALTRADESAIRASRIIRRIRDVARRPSGVGQRESLNSLVKEACDLAFADAASLGVEAHVYFGDTDASVMVDRIEIQQALMNLVSNAMEAVAGQSHRHIFVSVVTRPDNFCEVIVRDNGPGIPAETVGRLFEPFHTTKANGVGIGLSISRTIIESHFGKLWLASAADSGAEFRISLPLMLE